MERASDILKSALRKLNDPAAAPAWLAANWLALAGERIAAHARPTELHEGVVRIQADSAAWKLQVEAMGATIRERVNRAWGGALIQRVRVDANAPQHPRLSYADDNRHTPFVRKRNPNHHEDQ
ncbi:MAG TPA: DUF721 domain-containing protein [Candidatus Acidoferrales bacterium]|nr:DUF721 domain-containing protein [Candidatus Acidoferrales bacterium]